MLGEAKIEVVRLEFKSLKDFSALALTRYGNSGSSGDNLGGKIGYFGKTDVTGNEDCGFGKRQG